MWKQVQSLTQHNCSLIALEGEDGSFTPLTASFGVILFAKPADTLYLEMWLCYVLPSLFIIAVSVLSLQNAFRNFQQCSFERKHSILFKKYSPEDNQKSKLAKKKKKQPKMCIAAASDIYEVCSSSQSWRIFWYAFLHMSCSYILNCCFCCHACTGKTACVFSLLCSEAGSHFISFETIVCHLQKKILWNFITN